MTGTNPRKPLSQAVDAAARLKSGYTVATVATLASAVLFVGLGNELFPAWSWEQPASAREQSLIVIFLLNIALILFGWRRSKDLKRALEAHAVAEQRAHEAAFLDHVTGLSNRRELIRRIDQVLASADPTPTLLMLDLDHFKKVNDVYGHAAGDRLLQVVARILESCVPRSACCARLGGDEFAVLLPGAFPPEHATDIAERILDALARPLPLNETTAHVTTSIGLATADSSCNEAASLLRRSDMAMYEAKRLGRNCYSWFDGEMERQLNRRTQLEADMREGIGRGEFVPYFQPLINLGDGELKGFEVLARWHHPARGLLMPEEFIPIAEASGLISTLSFDVMRKALAVAREWPANVSIAVNISPVQFKDPLLAQRILQLLTETGFPPQRLEIEVTEGALLEDQDLALATVESLKNSGVRISLDDFGTGYASLSQLKSLPFDRIKIDRSFVSSLLEDEQSSAIVSTIAKLGKSLRLPITAEGVESEDVCKQLQMIGCSDAQGWLFGEAVPADAIQAMLDSAGGVSEAGRLALAASNAALTRPARTRKRRSTASRSGTV